jgi:hypothetical protein
MSRITIKSRIKIKHCHRSQPSSLSPQVSALKSQPSSLFPRPSSTCPIVSLQAISQSRKTIHLFVKNSQNDGLTGMVCLQIENIVVLTVDDTEVVPPKSQKQIL